jgi:hypothetical protein
MALPIFSARSGLYTLTTRIPFMTVFPLLLLAETNNGAGHPHAIADSLVFAPCFHSLQRDDTDILF